MRARSILTCQLAVVAAMIMRLGTWLPERHNSAATLPGTQPQRLAVPAKGMFYHGVYPGGKSGEEDDITLADLKVYQQAVGQHAAWVYFSNNWYRSRAFPEETAAWIRQAGSVPYIRLMLRARNHEEGQPEKLFSLQAIIDGTFDADLKVWGTAAAKFNTPILAEYGVEMNGDWFGWNGKFHGGAQKTLGDPDRTDGPARFVQAYRHIIQVVRAAGAANVSWAFHLDVSQSPDQDWNRFENYYPGDDWIDLLAVSCYGAQKPGDNAEEAASFRDKFDPVYARIVKMSAKKPVLIAEFGCTAGCPHVKPEVWASAALDDLLSSRWENVRGFSWWNERWENDDNHQHDTTMRVQDIKPLAEGFRARLAQARDKLVTAATGK